MAVTCIPQKRRRDTCNPEGAAGNTGKNKGKIKDQRRKAQS